MRTTGLCRLSLVLLSATLGYADEPGSPGDPNGAVPTPPAEYWQQFSGAHQTTVPVLSWLWNAGEPFALWSGVLAARESTLLWDPVTASVCLQHDAGDSGDDDEQQETQSLAVWTEQDGVSRPTFVLALGDETVALGVIDVDEAQRYVVLELTLAGEETTRQIVAEVTADNSCVSWGDATVVQTTCTCFGASGGTTAACTTANCDNGESCGTAGNGTNKACRWVANVEPTAP